MTPDAGSRVVPPRFTHFAAIDWSGAAGERQPGIAVAVCEAAGGAPRLIAPPGNARAWSREEVLAWIVEEAPTATLIGFDMGISLAFADTGAFFPGWQDSPPEARALWTLIENICADEPHLGVATFVDHPEASRHFRRHGGRQGEFFADLTNSRRQGRLRVTEYAQRLAGCRPTSNFNLVGAGQVGKASLSGMRLLCRLPPDIAVWPIDPLPDDRIGGRPGKVVVEIYTALAAIAAGRSAGRSKIRSHAELDQALAALGSPPVDPSERATVARLSDHASDAIVTSAWMRSHACRSDLWSPPLLTGVIARTEGWTFGAA